MVLHNAFNNFPIFYLQDFTLRELSIHDAENFLSYILNPNVNKFLSENDIPKDEEEAKREVLYWSRLFYQKSSLYWGIANKQNKLIGSCGFNSLSFTHKRGELSYDLDFEYWGQGIMTRALKKICDFALNELKLQRIQATVAEDNIRSLKLLMNLGFEKEGLMKNYGILHKRKKDFYMCSITK